MKWLENTVDEFLKKMSKEGVLMKSPDPNMPFEMIDSSISAEDDWKGWKPIESILTKKDLNNIEELININLPESYRSFLKHKHFYELQLNDYNIKIHSHLPDKDLKEFKDLYFKSYDPEYVIKKGLIHFADFNDSGLLCFDSTQKRENNEYPIVFLDYSDLSTKHDYCTNFKELIQSDEKAGNCFIIKLNAYHRKNIANQK